MQDLAGDMAESVREDLRQELAQLRDDLDKFSIDAQWTARKIREKPAQEIESVRETLQGEITDLRGSLEQFMADMRDALIRGQEPSRNQPPLCCEQIAAEQERLAEEAEIERISHKAFTGSAAVAHAVRPQRDELRAEPSPASPEQKLLW